MAASIVPQVSSDLLIAAIYGLILTLVAAKQYLEQRKATRSSAAVAPANAITTAAIGLGYGEREQMDRLIEQIKRIADALTDKNVQTIDSRLEGLAEAIDHLREQQAKHDDLLGMRAGRSRRAGHQVD